MAIVKKLDRNRNRNHQNTQKYSLLKRDIPELLTWLEYSKGTETGNRFKQTAIDHFRDYLGKSLSFSQIDKEIERLWDDHKHGEAKNFSSHICLYRLGISGLSRATTNWRDTSKWIKRQVMQLQHGARRKALLRNGAANGTSILPTPPRPKSAIPAKYRVPSPEDTPEQLLRTSESCDETSQSQVVHECVPASPIPEIPQTPCYSVISEVENKPESARSLTISEPALLEVEVETMDHGSCQQVNFEALYYGDYSCSNYRCRKKIKDLTKAIVLNNEQMTILKQSIHSTIQGDLPEKRHEVVAAELARCRVRVMQLESMVRDKQRNTSFTRMLGARTFCVDRAPLEQRMKELQVAIQHGIAFEDTEMYETCTEIPLVISTELSALLRRVLGRHEAVVGKVEFQALVCALISASVCVWVLESRLVDECLQSTPILEMCLSELGLQDGREALRNLHFAANKRFLETEHFQHNVIPRKAAVLAGRFVQALEELFAIQGSRHQWSFDVTAMCHAQEPRLCKIFCAALRVKTEAVTCRAVFETDFPPSGTPFVADRMHTIGTTGLATTKSQPRSVLVSLIPGLRIFGADPDIVDYHSFRRPNFDAEAKVDQIGKPLVLTE